MSIPPPHPASRYPRREYAVALNELVGWTQIQVRAKLGAPNEKHKGNLWASDHPGLAFQRDDYSGALRKLPVFGPVPKNIPVGAPYQEWIYHNVRGSTWILYFARATREPPSASKITEQIARAFRSLGAPIVVETYQYPTGAVF